ncbi:MAG: hypothetical protein EOP10_16450 [Proteobacteria bacterium]|nr:MAG: hypothetical protein EOP10_16450 [Pseudomonadota bacterium]
MNHFFCSWFAILSLLLTLSCKSYKPTPGVRESIAEHGKKVKPSPTVNSTNKPSTTKPSTTKPRPSGSGGEDELVPENVLMISKLNLSSEVARYNRSCVIVQTKGKADVVIQDYKLGTPIELEPFKDYTVLIELYMGNTFVYSNSFCETGRTFNANVGRNIFTFPVCYKENEEALPTAGCGM